VSRVQTFSGAMVDVIDPEAETICLYDVMLSLSRRNRFGGQTLEPWSVLEHCVAGAFILLNLDDPESALGFLVHEFGEVYLPDVPSPLKKFASVDGEPWKELELIHTERIIESIGLPMEAGKWIYGDRARAMDLAMMLGERAVLMPFALDTGIMWDGEAGSDEDLTARCADLVGMWSGRPQHVAIDGWIDLVRECLFRLGRDNGDLEDSVFEFREMSKSTARRQS